MSGYDFQWASFHCVDVMSQPRFKAKRIGFVAAAQSFNDSTDVMLLTTNLFRKAFASSQYECSLAVGCLAKIATPDLSRDLLGDVATMLFSFTPPGVRGEGFVTAVYFELEAEGAEDGRRRQPPRLAPEHERLQDTMGSDL